MLALELCDLADLITRERFRREDLHVRTKPDMTPVTEADTAVEEALRGQLGRRRAGDSILGEEFGRSEAPQSSRRWIIDPIDGTKNYVRGIPVWATLLALQEEDELVLGVVSAPALERRWWAARGAGAYMFEPRSESPRPLGVSAVDDLADAQMLFSEFEIWDREGRLGALLDLAKKCWRTRGFGDFWAYMLVAEGAVELSVEPEVSLWDLAAPRVIVEEAGGRFSDLAGTTTAAGGDAVASNGLLHDAALAIVGR